MKPLMYIVVGVNASSFLYAALLDDPIIAGTALALGALSFMAAHNS